LATGIQERAKAFLERAYAPGTDDVVLKSPCELREPFAGIATKTVAQFEERLLAMRGRAIGAKAMVEIILSGGDIVIARVAFEAALGGRLRATKGVIDVKAPAIHMLRYDGMVSGAVSEWLVFEPLA
jgi:hypothetical protein